MTAEENRNIKPRAGRAFRFYVDGVEFFPGAGTRLHYASQAVDTLSLTDVPHGLLAASAEVSVTYHGSCVFRGTVEQIVERHGRGDERADEVTCQGPWGRMQRLVFRQRWGVSDLVSFVSSRVVLNQSPAGLPYTQAEQLREIVSYGAAKCGYSYAPANVAGKEINLPLDESRDITVAAAIQRELRFFPKSVVRFDYSKTQPEIHIAESSGTKDASYVAAIPKTVRQYEWNAHPITGVYLYTEDLTVEVGGRKLSESAQRYPADADPDDIDCLSAFIPLARGYSSTSWASFKAEGETIGDAYNTSAEWWKARHPRLANVAAANITISGGSRSNHDYDYIASATTDELEAAGLHAKVCRFSCRAKIDTGDDIEEEMLLTMDYLTTDAVPGRKYTWQTGSESAAGETLPDGLAEAIFRQRSGALKNETMGIRLGDTFPTLGDACDGLFLQEFDVDCDTQTAQLHFGQPEYLSVDDMRGILSGFRGRGYASNSPARMGMGKDGDDDAGANDGGNKCIQPLSSTEFCPGTKTKTTIGGGASGGKIVLDPSGIGSGETMDTHKLTFGSAAQAGSGGKSSAGIAILATGDVNIPTPDVSAGSDGADVNGSKVYVTVRKDESSLKWVVDLSDTPDGGGTTQNGDGGCCNQHSDDGATDPFENDAWSLDPEGDWSGFSGGGGGDGPSGGAGEWSRDKCPNQK